MKRKTSALNCFFSLFLSVTLVFATCTFSDALVSAIGKSVIKISNTTEDVKEISRAIYSGGADEKANEAAFSPKGFGSGSVFRTLTQTPDDIKALMKDAEALYKSYKKTGNIEEKQYGASSVTVSCGGVSMSNKTETASLDMKALLKEKPSFGNITKDEPYVLIYHTHTTEGYELLDKGWYSDSYNSRTKDTSKNIVRVGDEIASQLEDAGFKVIHDKTVYDASYTGAYSRSLVSVNKYLEKYPSIVITLDVHRDAIHYDSGVKSKPTAVIDGKKAAQVMIITGCEEGSISGYPNWQKNLVFALSLQSKASESFSGLMRPVMFCQRKYNMNVTPCSLLLEFGTDANTLDEAAYSGRLIGKSLADILNENIKGGIDIAYFCYIKMKKWNLKSCLKNSQ